MGKRCRTIATTSNFGETTLQTNTGYGMSQRPLCCYYLQGRCTFGFDCRFTHAEKAALATHTCQFGLACRVGHGQMRTAERSSPCVTRKFSSRGEQVKLDRVA